MVKQVLIFMCRRILSRTLMLILCMAIIVPAIAQEIEKLSAGTQMFLMMRADDATKSSQSSNMAALRLRPEVERGIKFGFAPVEIVNGNEMIDAFIYLKNIDDVSSLESMGVEVMCKFDGFVTAKIPVDRIEKVGELDNVVQIDISRLLQPKTDIASSVTNADKAWEGLSNGLCNDYTGKGVLVGVVDQGIHFKHIAFTDNNGNSRVKRVYAPGKQSSVYTNSNNFPDYDISNASHGTHTSTTAGGRAITVNGTTYTGMAPECDLFLCGLNTLSSTNIANSLSKIKSYAASTGQPCVVNISLGSQYGAHDGTGSLSSAYSSFTENGTAKGRVLCVSAGNEAGDNMYFRGTASSTIPAVTSLEYNPYSDVDGSCTYTYYYDSNYYSEYYVWPRTSGAALKFQFVIIDKETNSLVYTTNVVTPGSSYGGNTVSLGSSYFKYNNGNASINISRGTDYYSGKYYYDITVKGTTTENSENMSTTSDGKLLPRYAVGMLVYSTSNSPVQFDCWCSGFSSFMDIRYAGTYDDLTFANGSDECSIGNEVATSGIISVGAYVSKKTVTTSNNISFTSDEYTVGDIAPFSSYSTGCGPDGIVYPDITAPGAVLIAGVNKYDTSNYPSSQSTSEEYMTIGNYSDGSRYGSMSGTSMSTPTTTGIMALWLQANNELTVNDIKQIFSQTAVRDSYVTGANEAHFGKYGKLDALAGLNAISPCDFNPTISVNPSELTLIAKTGESAIATFNVKGINLEGDVTLELTDPSDVFSLSTTTLSASQLDNGIDVTVTFNGSEEGQYTGFVTLTSPNADTKTVQLTAIVNDGGTASDAYLDIAKYATIDEAGAIVGGMSSIYNYTEYPENGTAWLTISNYGAMQSDANQNWFTINGEHKSSTETWNAYDIFSGSASYFTGTSYYANWNEAYHNFYVTNCSQVKQYSYNIQSTNYSGNVYPLKMEIYECTLNDDGSLTEGTTTVDYKESTQTNTIEVVTSANLDPTKIYKVAIYNDYSRLYEIGFQTPICNTVTLAELIANGNKDNNYKITDLICVDAIDDGSLLCKDEGALSYAYPDTPEGDAVDFMATYTPGGVLAQGAYNTYDQSNWIILKPAAGMTLSTALVGKKLTNVTGKITNVVNPELELSSVPETNGNASYVPNTYLVGAFSGANTQEAWWMEVLEHWSGINTQTVFFVQPKPLELVHIVNAEWDGSKFITHPITIRIPKENGDYTYNALHFEGSIDVVGASGLTQGGIYELNGVASVNISESKDGSKSYTITNATITAESVITAVRDLNVNVNGEIESVTYFNVAGMKSSKPFDGVNIVVTRYTDGHISTNKIVK